MTETQKKQEMRGIMTYMRDKTPIVIWGLVFSFVGFIIFSWGMDIMGMSAPTPQSVLAEVNGTEISIQDFRRRMGSQIELLRQQLGTSPDVQDQRLLEDQVYNDMINEILIGDAIEELGLFATDDEIVQEVRLRPRPEFVNSPDFRTEDGTFDVVKYNSFLSSQLSPSDYLQLEADARIQIPQRKLQDLLTSTIRVTEEEIKQAYLQREQHVEVEYMLAKSNLFVDAVINISEKEIEDYYQAHLEDYFEDETRQLRYTIFDISPTSADSAAIDLQIDEALLRANNEEDFTELAQEYSGANGDLGMFAKGAMMAEIENAVFAAGTKEGDILGPIDSPLGKHIIKIRKIVESNGSIDSVHAAYILFTYAPSTDTEDNVEVSAQDFEYRAKDEGFEKVANEIGKPIFQTIPFSRFGFSGFGAIPEVETFAFDSEFDIDNLPVSDAIETPLGYVVFQLSNMVEERTKSLDDENVRFSIRQVLIEQQQIQMAQNLMARVKTDIDTGTPFEDAAEKEGFEVIIPDPFKVNDYISEVGADIIFTSTAFGLDPGNVSAPVTANNGVYLIKLNAKEPFDEDSYNESKTTISDDLLQQKRGSAFSSWLLKLRELADIEDNRDRFLY